jgi:hypothetical protein
MFGVAIYLLPENKLCLKNISNAEQPKPDAMKPEEDVWQVLCLQQL